MFHCIVSFHSVFMATDIPCLKFDVFMIILSSHKGWNALFNLCLNYSNNCPFTNVESCPHHLNISTHFRSTQGPICILLGSHTHYVVIRIDKPSSQPIVLRFFFCTTARASSYEAQLICIPRILIQTDHIHNRFLCLHQQVFKLNRTIAKASQPASQPVR